MTVKNKKQLAALKAALEKSGLEYVITRTEGDLCHINVWIGEV
tara:strand:+ start:583 stop:711 length:129 start_codon:yes stop_codon:yes gene_type:complete